MLYVSLTSPTQFISHPSHFIGSFKYYQQLNTSSISDRRSSVLYFNEPASGCANFVDKEENEAEVSVEDRSSTRQLKVPHGQLVPSAPLVILLYSILSVDVLARCHAITEYISPWILREARSKKYLRRCFGLCAWWEPCPLLGLFSESWLCRPDVFLGLELFV